jgi:formylglycine-generating enzyme required for sulfatase activity
MFTNWLTSGDVTKGAYTVNGSGEVTGIDRASAQSTYGTTYFLPTEDEWYKAAYYDPNKSGGGYWDYPTRSDILPDGIDVEGDTSFDAVFRDGVWWYPPERPNSVDNTGVLSAYGTMGQGGNVWEWNETAIGSSRGIRGGRWLGESNFLHASHRASYDPATPENYGIGFRVASSEVVVPEPSSLVAFASLGLTGIAIMGWRRNRNRLAR